MSRDKRMQQQPTASRPAPDAASAQRIAARANELFKDPRVAEMVRLIPPFHVKTSGPLFRQYEIAKFIASIQDIRNASPEAILTAIETAASRHHSEKGKPLDITDPVLFKGVVSLLRASDFYQFFLETESALAKPEDPWDESYLRPSGMEGAAVPGADPYEPRADSRKPKPTGIENLG